MKKILFSIMLTLSSYQAFACSKHIPGPDEFSKFDFIVLGKVLQVRDNLNLQPDEVSFVSNYDVEIEVLKRYMGASGKTEKVHLEECSSPPPKAGEIGIFFVMDEGRSASIFKAEKDFYREWKHHLKNSYE